MKLKHFNKFFLRLLIFSLVCIPFSVLSDSGTCNLVQYPDGTFRIVCEGDGLWINYVDRTNDVYIIENCEELKADLLSAVGKISSDLMGRVYDVEGMRGDLDNIISASDEIEDSSIREEIYTKAQNSIQSLENISAGLRVVNSSLVGLDQNPPSLRSRILSIECGSCSTNSSSGGGGGSCCNVDFTPILDKMNLSRLLLVDIDSSLTNVVDILNSSLFGQIGNSVAYRYHRYAGSANGVFSVSTSPSYSSSYQNLRSYISTISYNIANALPSLNNYLYKISFQQLPNISNNLEVVKDTTLSLYNASTNHFSFFREQVSVFPALEDWTPDQGSYYDFLTNYYVRVVNRDSSLSSTSKTNWFSRIETLLASLVFADGVSSTNSVDESYGRNEKDSIIDSMSGLSASGGSQVELLGDASRSLISSIRAYSSAFSDSSMPSTVRLMRFDDPSGSESAEYIEFQSSEISPLVEACHCATTVAWCLGGLVLLFWFIHWTVKTASSLFVFCYSVLSSIFGK